LAGTPTNAGDAVVPVDAVGDALLLASLALPVVVAIARATTGDEGAGAPVLAAAAIDVGVADALSAGGVNRLLVGGRQRARIAASLSSPCSDDNSTPTSLESDSVSLSSEIFANTDVLLLTGTDADADTLAGALGDAIAAPTLVDVRPDDERDSDVSGAASPAPVTPPIASAGAMTLAAPAALRCDESCAGGRDDGTGGARGFCDDDALAAATAAPAGAEAAVGEVATAAAVDGDGSRSLLPSSVVVVPASALPNSPDACRCRRRLECA
jgi:hypothetical protein